MGRTNQLIDPNEDTFAALPRARYRRGLKTLRVLSPVTTTRDDGRYTLRGNVATQVADAGTAPGLVWLHIYGPNGETLASATLTNSEAIQLALALKRTAIDGGWMDGEWTDSEGEEDER